MSKQTEKTEITLEAAEKKIAEERQKKLQEFSAKLDKLCKEYNVIIEATIQARIIHS